MRLVALLLTAVLLAPAPSWAQSEVETGIRSTFAERIPLRIAPFTAIDGTRRDHATTLEQLVAADLEFSGVFKIERGSIPLAGNGNRDGLVEIRGALYLRRGDPHFEGRLIDVSTKQQIGGKRYRVRDRQIRQIAHHFADEVVRMLTGEHGIASTHILFRRKHEDRWEIVMSDYDGYNPRVLLRQSVPLLYPRWIDGSKAIVYTSFRYGKPDLYLRYLKEPASKRVASYDGLNYSVDWSQKRKQMVATLSKDGDPEIYILDANGKVKRRLTHTRAIETSAAWSPSGREVVFTSDRAGTPQIYVMEADGSNVRRLTFYGSYNDSPCWSPKGDRVAFASRIDGIFHLCTIRPDGTGLTQITSEAVSHEDPRWAPNGRHIVYAEGSGGDKVISIIDTGTGGKRILSKGESPDWSLR